MRGQRKGMGNMIGLRVDRMLNLEAIKLVFWCWRLWVVDPKDGETVTHLVEVENGAALCGTMAPLTPTSLSREQSKPMNFDVGPLRGWLMRWTWQQMERVICLRVWEMLGERRCGKRGSFMYFWVCWIVHCWDNVRLDSMEFFPSSFCAISGSSANGGVTFFTSMKNHQYVFSTCRGPSFLCSSVFHTERLVKQSRHTITSFTENRSPF